MKIYSVSTRHYFAFGALVSEELSYKLKGIYILLFVFFLQLPCISVDLLAKLDYVLQNCRVFVGFSLILTWM